jgi:hypothetical protein
MIVVLTVQFVDGLFGGIDDRQSSLRNLSHWLFTARKSNPKLWSLITLGSRPTATLAMPVHGKTGKATAATVYRISQHSISSSKSFFTGKTIFPPTFIFSFNLLALKAR